MTTVMHAGDKESQAGPTLASNYTMEPQSSQRPVLLLGLGTLFGYSSVALLAE